MNVFPRLNLGGIMDGKGRGCRRRECGMAESLEAWMFLHEYELTSTYFYM
jgi:hypothetical protein